MLKKIAHLLLLVCPVVLNAQSQATLLKAELGAAFTGNFTLEVEKCLSSRFSLWTRLGIVDAHFAPSPETGNFQPHIGGFKAKFGPKVYLTPRIAIRGEIGYSRTLLPQTTSILMAWVEYHSGAGITVSYTCPIGDRFFVEPFGGLGYYQSRLVARVRSEGFGNDSYLIDQHFYPQKGYPSPTHLVIGHGKGVVFGLNIGIRLGS